MLETMFIIGLVISIITISVAFCMIFMLIMECDSTIIQVISLLFLLTIGIILMFVALHFGVNLN